jgi:hypothetical protein
MAISLLVKNLKQQQSLPLAAAYLWKFVTRRGPTAAKRWLSVRQQVSAAQKSAAQTATLKLGVYVTGGVGDQIIAARFLRDLQSSTEPFEFDIFSANPKIAGWIFSGVAGFQNCYFDKAFDAVSETYPLSLDIASIVSVRGGREVQNGLSEPLAKAVSGINRFNSEMQFLLNAPGRMDGFIAQKLQFNNVTRAVSAHHMAGIAYGGDEFPLPTDPACLGRFGLESKRYITVHNGFEAQYITAGSRATKCYPHFDEVVALLKRETEDLVVVQIGSNTSIPIPGAINLIGKTSLIEAASVIQGSAAHLDNESGMVHIASCFSVPCCVVFGPTPADYFGYSNNVNVRPKVCGNCWWITEDWMDRCPRNFAEPPCTYSQPPAEVAQAMSGLLSQVGEKAKFELAG